MRRGRGRDGSSRNVIPRGGAEVAEARRTAIRVELVAPGQRPSPSTIPTDLGIGSDASVRPVLYSASSASSAPSA
jgi:hypothetical protein